MAGMDHAAMPGMRAGSAVPIAAAASAAEHAGHAAAAAPIARTTPGASAGPATPVPSAPAETLAPDSATAKLILLARELVRDSVVQRRIEEDPALREAWERPEVRAVVTGETPR